MTDEVKYLTPNQIARERHMRVATIHAYIAAGLIEAIDHRSPGASRPAWKISRQALAEFDRRRSSLANMPAKSQAPRRRRTPAVTQYV